MYMVEQEVLLKSDTRVDPRYDFADQVQVAGRKTSRRFWCALAIVLCTNLSLSIITLTLWPYLALTVQGIYIMAVTIAAYYTGCSVGQKVFTHLSQLSNGYWSQVCLAAGLCTVGDILYASYPQQIAIVMARFIAGIGSGSMVGLQGIMLKSNDKATRLARLTMISNTVSLAHIVGPALVAIVSNFQMDKTFNVSGQDTGTISFYGWLAAFFSFLSVTLSFVGKSMESNQGPILNNEEIYVRLNTISLDPSPVISTGQYRNYNMQQSCILSPRITLYALCFVHFLLYNIAMIIETTFIPYIFDTGGYSAYNWSMTQISLYFIGVGASTMLSSYLCRKVDNKFLMFMASLGITLTGFALMNTWVFVPYVTVPKSPSPNIIRFMLGVVLVNIGIPSAISSSISMFFEIMSTVHIQNASAIFIMASSFGRLLGPMFSAMIFDSIAPNYDFFFGTAVSAGALIILLLLGRSINDLIGHSGSFFPGILKDDASEQLTHMEEGEVMSPQQKHENV